MPNSRGLKKLYVLIKSVGVAGLQSAHPLAPLFNRERDDGISHNDEIPFEGLIVISQIRNYVDFIFPLLKVNKLIKTKLLM